MAENLNVKIVNATKWSAITEILSKLVTPITSIVMARLLTPESFGVVASFSIIISFAEVFADAGFQRFIIQHEFGNDDELDRFSNVAFWSNLVLSFALWGLISLFSDSLAELVGSPGLGKVLVITCFSIPITGLCSIQMALFKREFDFKTLFWRRLVSIIIPLVVTIPLALWLRNYWALVIGTLSGTIANALLLYVKSDWKPRRFFSFSLLQKMFSFCSWSYLDAFLVWATAYADVFFIARTLNSYYLGLYRTSISIVGQIVSLITAVVLPVIMPSLSRLQNDYPEMRRVLLSFQKTTGLILLPLGAGIFAFRSAITMILLGSQWTEASEFLGLWGLMEAITVIFARFCSPVYPAIGKPRISAIVQLSHLIVLIPAIIISGNFGFKALYITRSLVRIELVIVNLIAVYCTIGQSPWKMLMNIFPELSCSIIMYIVALGLLRINNGVAMSLLWIIVCIVVYFSALCFIFPKERYIVQRLFKSSLKAMRRN